MTNKFNTNYRSKKSFFRNEKPERLTISDLERIFSYPVKTGFYSAVILIEDMEDLPRNVNGLLEKLYRSLGENGYLVIPLKLWERVKFQPTLRGLYLNNEYRMIEDLIIF